MRSRVKKRETLPSNDAGRPKTRAELVAENAALRDQLAALETSRADAPPTAGNPQGAADPASTDRARQLEAVRTVSEEITRELNLSSLLNLILQRAVDLVGAVGGTILFWDATEQVLVPQVHSELFGTLEWRQIPAGVGVVGRVAATRSGLRINDYRAWSGALTTALARTGVTASMAEPLLYRDTLVGVINTVHTDGRATFSEHDADTLRLFANQAAIAIENARLYEAARRELHERQQAESRLRQRESQYRRIVETATEGIWALDADNRTTFANGKMADMLGYATQEMLGRPLFDFIAEEERPKSAAAMERRRQGVAEQIERSFVRKDGTRLVALVNTSPIYDETGQFAGSFGMLTDITGRRQAEQALADRTRQLDALRLVSEEITRELDLDMLLGLITRRAVELVAGMGGGVYLWDETAQQIMPHAYHGTAESQGRFPRRLGEGLIGHVARTRQGMIVNDYRAAPFAHPRTLDTTNISAVLAEPFSYRDRFLGVIAVHHDGGARVFTAQDQETLRLFANQAAIAIENARLYKATQRELLDRQQAQSALQVRTQQIEAVRAVGEEIARELDLPRLLNLVVRRAVDLVGTAGGSLYLWDEADQVLVPSAWSRHGDWLSQARVGYNQGLGGTVAARREGMIVNDYRNWPSASPLVLERSRITAAVAEPLLSRERLVGVIILDAEEGERRFSEEDQRILSLLATQAAIAIENARLFASAQHELAERARAEAALTARTRQLEAARRTTIDITRELHVSALLDLLVERAVDLIAVRSGTLFLWDDAADALVSQVTSGLGEWFSGVRLALGEGVAGAVAQQRMGLIVNDYRSSLHTIPWFVERTDVTAVLGEPLLYRDRLVGVILLRDRRDRQPFTADDQGLLRLFAAQAAIAIENAQLYEATRRRAEQFATLNDIARTLTTTLDPQRAAEQALRAVQVLLPEAAVRLWEHGPEEGVFRHVAGVGVPDRSEGHTVRFTPGEGLLGLTLTTRRPVISRDVNSDPRYREKARARAHGFVSCVMLPLLVADRVSGVLAIFTRTLHEFSDEELALLTSFAAQVAIAIENARLFAELKRAYQEVQRAQDELIRSEKLRALGQMAAGMAHDLNNVLAAVLGQAELLRLRIPDPAIHESLSTLVTAATDGAQIVRRLQDFARQQPGRPPAAVDLASAVREALEITSSRWKDEPQQRGLLIRVETALDSLPPVLGHAAEIREALTNLIINAVDAMPQGGTLAVQGQLVESSRSPSVDSSMGQPDGSVLPSSQSTNEPIGPSISWVELTVTDTGVGMAEDVRRRIFDPFFTTKGVKGSGLGLSVVYGIMQRHQGSIDVVSAPGRGTTFVLRFQAAPTADTLPQSVRGRQSFPPRRLLLIDDESTVRQTLSALLRAAGHQVSEYDEGTKGLAHLGEHSVDLVVTDLGMPEMSGWDVTRAVKAAHPRLPVILLTGWGEHPASQADHPSLVDRILGKPVRLDELLVAIDQLTAPGDRGPDASAIAPASS